MKSYKKELSEFIDYVLEKYKKDKRVCAFKEVFEKQVAVREKNKLAVKKKQSVGKKDCITVSMFTANLCRSLISAELEREKMLHSYNEKFILDLTLAQKELKGDYLIGLLYRINSRG